VSEMRTEEEQVQALSDWWKENGKSLLLGIAAALAIVMGWKAWQQNQQRNAENASALYQNLVEAVVNVAGGQGGDAALTTAHHLGNQLKTDFEGEAYARFAALLLARIAVDKGELDTALAELDWVLTHEPDAEQKVLATLRKARILAAQDKVEQGLALVDGLNAPAFSAPVAEVKGDLYLKQGARDKARAAYQVAVGDGAAQRPLLRMKLDDLAAEEK